MSKATKILAFFAMLGLLPAVAPAQTQRPAAPLSVDSDPVPTPDPGPRTPAAPQQPAAGNQAPATDVTGENGHYTLHTSAYEVRLNASVIDANGANVTDLPKDAFRVYEDGVQQDIVGFRHEDLPVSIGLLVDSSGSMYDKRQAVDAASLDLVRLSNPADEAFLVDFSSNAYLDQDFTNDIAKLQNGLSYVKSSGGTALYDAVVEASDHLAKYAKHSKQVILVITDGDDNASASTLEETIRRVQDYDGPAIYCVGLLFGDDVSRSEARHSREVLGQLAEETGGIAYFPKSLKEVDEIAHEVAADIRAQYTIEYRSSKSPSLGGYRKIHVEAKEKGYRNLQVRTRSGYFPKVASGTAPTTSGQ